ncbi:MAG: ribosomal RNA small subunit methyltransferase A [Parcubacteria group bacterium]|nr:ribosomal RNA small subunit methyltransferase A [Parcubacteria group bacterium]
MNAYAKKSLGQHFLTSKAVVEDLIRAAAITKDDIVLEVGPGKGFITEELVKTAKKVIAIEKDERLADFLKNKFAKEIARGTLEVVPADILSFSPNDYGLMTNDYLLVGAIPYYITGILLRKVLENPVRPKIIALIIQKEVAERIIAADSKESLLSLSVKAFGEPKYIQTVPAGVFSPSPKVDSAILTIENISDSMFGGSTSKHWFFKVLHAGFAHKRKMLISSLASGLEIEKDTLTRVFDECGIDHKARPEEIGLEKWGCLTKNI